MKAIEVWKDVPNYNGMYQVSSKGRIRSMDRTIQTKQGYRRLRGKVLSCAINSRGYYIINLSKLGIKQTHKIHHLVAKTFIRVPDWEEHVHHIDHNKLNNDLSNLEIMSCEDHMKLHGLTKEKEFYND